MAKRVMYSSLTVRVVAVYFLSDETKHHQSISFGIFLCNMPLIYLTEQCDLIKVVNWATMTKLSISLKKPATK
jgi:hypothetical protein